MMHLGKMSPSKGAASRFKSSVKQVLVSQSENKWANHALEDWVSRNMDRDSKDILVLSRSRESGVASRNITATFLGKGATANPGSQFDLLCCSLPPSLPLQSVPAAPAALTEGGGSSLSVQLSLPEDVDTQIVLKALQNIGMAYLAQKPISESLGRLTLVRPDDGWFPGIGQIQEELEHMVQVVEARGRRTAPVKMLSGSREKSGGEVRMANSFGVG